MTVKLIADPILDADDILSATSEAGMYISQPSPEATNEGNLKPVASGTPADFSHDGIATSAGSTTTLVDDTLTAYGTGYFVGFTITFTSGANDGQIKTITAFDSSTGELTWSGALTATAIGDQYTLSFDADDLDFDLIVTGSGDPGNATFKWSFDGGSNFLGRDDPFQATWENQVFINSSTKSGAVALIESTENDNLLLVYQDGLDTNDACKCQLSTDRGMTWGTAVSISGSYAGIPSCITRLTKGPNAGRILVGMTYNSTHMTIWATDDEGSTWQKIYDYTTANNHIFWGLLQLSDGQIAAIEHYDSGGTYYIKYGLSDNGSNWTWTTVTTDTSTFYPGDLAELDNGDILVTFCSDTVSTGNFEARTYRSTDGGSSFSADTTIISHDSLKDWTFSRLLKDIDGSLLAAVVQTFGTGVDTVWVSKSSDNGATWETEVSALEDTTNHPKRCDFALLGSEVILAVQCEGSIGSDLLAGEGDMEDTTDFDGDVGTPTTNERSTDYVYAGTYSRKLVCVSGEGAESDTMSVTAGDRYQCIGHVYSLETGTPPDWCKKILVKIYDGNGVLASSQRIDISDHDDWEEFSFVVTFNVTGTSAKIQVLNNDDDNDDQTFYIDGLLLQKFTGGVEQVRRGKWETYSPGSNDAVVPTGAHKSGLLCGVNLSWLGSAGEEDDEWTFGPTYSYGKENILTLSPSQPWRSLADGATASIVIDTGANRTFNATGIALFGCNWRSGSIQMNATNSWGSPSVDETISFDLGTGAVDAVSGAMLQDTSLLAGYADHELAGSFLIMTSGTDSGLAWKIKDNVGDWVILDTEDAHNIAASDTFAIYQDHIMVTFTGGRYPYIRLAIDAINTPDGYFEIGKMVIGEAVSLSQGIKVGYGHAINTNVLIERSGGNMPIPIKQGKTVKTWDFSVTETYARTKEVTALIDILEGGPFAMVLDDSDLTDCHLVVASPQIQLPHRFTSYHDLSWQVEEIK